MPVDLITRASDLAAAAERNDADFAAQLLIACRTARETTGGAIRTLSTGLRHRVYAGGALQSVQDLHHWVNELPPSDVRAWAGLALLAHALLGPGDVADDGEGGAPRGEGPKAEAFGAARRLVESAVSRGAGRCPAAAAPLARELVDAVLRDPMCDLKPALQVSLLRARAAFAKTHPQADA